MVDRAGRSAPEGEKGPYCTRIKVISMGDSGVGKSALIKRYCEERFVSKYIMTIGVDYGVKRISLPEQGHPDVRVNFLDLAGPQDFFEIRNEFYKDAQGAILVFDVCNKQSFASLDQWLSEAFKYGAPQNMIVVVCGNKSDVGKRVVTEKDARGWASSKGYAYYETSANSGDNVKLVFETIFREILRTFCAAASS